jgi:hypothetical protein
MLALGSPGMAWGESRGPLRVGAAKVDITPAPDAALPMAGFAQRKEGFKGIHDHIYVRAIVLDDGTTQAAFAAWELGTVPNNLWEDVSARVAKELGISRDHFFLLAVHDHAAPATIGGVFGGAATDGTAKFTAMLEDSAVKAVRLAQSRLQPARMGIGTGKAYVNINRREPMPGGSQEPLGFNENGPSDKTVTVLRFEDLSGKPIALLINYGVHCVVMGSKNYQISGDLAGATSRYVEQHYLGQEVRKDAGPRLQLRPNEKGDGNGMVALWTSGAAGDQNAITLEPGEDFSRVDALGDILGEEVVRVSSSIDASTTDAKIWGVQKVVSCPGRHYDQQTKEFHDTDPVNIRLSLLMLNRIALAGVSGEVFDLIHEHLNQQSPYTDTIMLTHANGYMGYIPDDTAYEHLSYEIMSSGIQQGCAEHAIINGFLDMMTAQ